LGWEGNMELTAASARMVREEEWRNVAHTQAHPHARTAPAAAAPAAMYGTMRRGGGEEGPGLLLLLLLLLLVRPHPAHLRLGGRGWGVAVEAAAKARKGPLGR
jgi:hypothetical protein